jgi:hypothetical protein
MGDGIMISLIPRTKRQEGEIDATSSVPTYYYSLVVGDPKTRSWHSIWCRRMSQGTGLILVVLHFWGRLRSGVHIRSRLLVRRMIILKYLHRGTSYCLQDLVWLGF